jgi:hypothetical protein
MSGSAAGQRYWRKRGARRDSPGAPRGGTPATAEWAGAACDEGIVTLEEFEAKKTDVLFRM